MAQDVIFNVIARDRASAAFSSAGKSADGARGKLSSLSKAAGTGLKVGLLGAAAAAVKFTRAAADDQKSAALMATSFRNAAGATREQIKATENWITKQGQAKGVTDDALRPALANLVNATHDVGKAQQLTSLAMDISAARGLSLEAVSKALAKAQNGQVAGLSKLGIKTKDASGKTLGLQDAMKSLSSTYSGAAATAADTVSGKQKRLQVTMSELGETIGYKLLPIFLKLTNAGVAAIAWMQKHATTVKVVGGAVLGLVVAVSAINKAMAAYRAVTAAASAVQVVFNAVLAANPIGLVVLAVAGLVAGLVIAYKKSETFRAIVDGAFRAVRKAAEFAFNWIKKNWPYLLGALAGPFGIAAVAIARHWGSIKAGAKAAKDFVVSRFTSIIDFVRGMPGRIGKAASGMFNGIKEAFRSAINWIIRKWNGLAFKIPSVDTHIPGVGKVGGFSIGTPNIPELADGGIVRARRGGTIVRVGEGGRDEAVIPLPRSGAAAGGGVNINVTINGAVDVVGTGRHLQAILTEYKNILGRDLGLA